MASERSPLFDSGAQNTLLLLVYAAIAIALMVLDRRMGYLNDLNAARHSLAQPIWSLAQAPGRLSDLISGYVSDRNTLQAEIEQQHALLLSQTTQISALNAQIMQDQALRELVGSINLEVTEGIVARVLSLDLGRYTHRFAINRGADDGLKMNAVLVDKKGLIGQVSELGPHTAVAVLISDSSHRVPARIRRNGTRVTVAGMGQNTFLQLDRMALTTDVKVGDWLETSGLGGVFPAGITIGQVQSLTREQSDRFLGAQVSPAANLLLDDMLIVLPPIPATGPLQPTNSLKSRRSGDTQDTSRRSGDTQDTSRRSGDTQDTSRRSGDTQDASRRSGDNDSGPVAPVDANAKLEGSN
jgi:rod shape-determining protein MreC